MFRSTLKINFVINDMKVYHAMFFLLNIHEATVYLVWTSINFTNLLRIFDFFSTKTTDLA